MGGESPANATPSLAPVRETAHLSQPLSPATANALADFALRGGSAGRRDGPGTPLRGTKRGVLNLKLGHPPAPLARLPALPSLWTSNLCNPFLQFFCSHRRPFLHSRHRALRSPCGRAGHPRAARLNPRPHVWRASPRGTEGSPVSHRTHSDPFWGARPEPQPPATSPEPPPHSPRAARRYSALREPPAAPARSRRRRASSEPEAKDGWEGR